MFLTAFVTGFNNDTSESNTTALMEILVPSIRVLRYLDEGDLIACQESNQFRTGQYVANAVFDKFALRVRVASLIWHGK